MVSSALSKVLIKEAAPVAEAIKKNLKSALGEVSENVRNPLSIEGFAEAARNRVDHAVALERNPSKLCRDISHRMLENYEAFGPAAWQRADVQGRQVMMGRMLKIFGEELELPREVQKRLTLETAALDERTLGATNLFVRLEKGGELVVDERVNPTITLNSALLSEGATFDQAMETLFHESLHVLQQSSVTESGGRILESAHQELWRNEIEEACRTNMGNVAGQNFEEYITSEMEAYPHAYDDYLVEVYNACLGEKLRGIMA